MLQTVTTRRMPLVALLAIVAPILLQALCIWHYGVNVPVADEWAFVPFVAQVSRGENWLPALFAQHNEHRYVVLRLALAANTWLVGWNSVGMMYTTLMVVVITLFGLWRIYRRTVGPYVWGFVPITWLHCCLVQYENIVWGMQLAFALVVACVVWAIYLLGFQSWRWLIMACVLGVASSFSAAAGLLVWPAGVVALWVRGVQWRWWTLWLGSAIITVVLYLWGYTQPAENSLIQPSTNVVRIVEFALRAVGAPLAAGNPFVALAAGAFLVGMAAVLCVQHVRHNNPCERAASVLGLIAFGLGCVAALTLGRLEKGMEWALVSRYTNSSMLVITGVLMLAAQRWYHPPHDSRLVAMLVPLVCIGVVAGNLYGHEQTIAWAQQSRVTMFTGWTSAAQTDEILIAARLDAHNSSVTARARLAELQAQHLSLFRDPIDWWLLTRWQEGTPLGEILPEQPVIQQFTCPVATLRDVAVVFATYQQANQGTLLLQLRDQPNGTVLGSRTMRIGDIRDNSWIFLPLDQPITQCNGKSFQMEISTPDAATGTTVTAWSYPAYYAGTLRQGNLPVAGRSLGIELNTQVYGIRQGQ